MTRRSARSKIRDRPSGAVDPRAVRTRTSAVAAYARLLVDRYPDAISVTDVLVESGLSRSGFYQRFASLDAVAAAAIHDVFSRIAEADRTARRRADHAGALVARDSVTAVARFLEGDARLHARLLSAPPAGAVHPALVAEAASGTNRVVDLLRPDLDAAARRRVSSAIGAAFAQALVDWLAEDDRGSAEAFADTFLQALPEWLVAVRPVAGRTNSARDVRVVGEKEEQA